MINKYTVSDEEFRNMFEKFGLITSAVVMKDADGKSRCFGFVNFQNFDNAAAAVENMNGVSCIEKVLFVGKAQRKSEREAELRAKFEQERISRFEKLKGANLYLKNLDDTINEETLKDLFSKFGTITSCKVNLDPQGISKGSGFVAFSNPDDAAVAVNIHLEDKVVAEGEGIVAVEDGTVAEEVSQESYLSNKEVAEASAQLDNARFTGELRKSKRTTKEPVVWMQEFSTGKKRKK
ncbi:hypothetical protein POM88_047837 [Heracleum sosnowskyi]|uniref:RRM domain-containing protein n=1 Tax=Heracleum sosnowskyi TaxID=360622 RepID=A0AAD8GV40_9APIA|nr:hypothetical protein POM88_047837 [Heracleum sosnowskyi]